MVVVEWPASGPVPVHDGGLRRSTEPSPRGPAYAVVGVQKPFPPVQNILSGARESVLGEGTDFVLDLPLDATSARDSRRPEAPRS